MVSQPALLLESPLTAPAVRPAAALPAEALLRLALPLPLPVEARQLAEAEPRRPDAAPALELQILAAELSGPWELWARLAA